MPVPSKNIDFDQVGLPEDDSTLSQDGPQGGGGGGQPAGGNGPGGSGTSNSQTTTRSDSYYFSISSNQTGWTLVIDGTPRTGQKTVRVLRENLAEKNTKIEIAKEGYISNTYYEVEMLNDGSPIINNAKLQKKLGLNTKDIVLTKYTNNEVVGLPKSITDTTSNELDFKLTKKLSGGGDEYEEPSSYKVTFTIGGEGAPVSVLKNGNKSAQFFPSVGESSYEDVDGTSYVISSADTSLYRIVDITITKPGNKPVILKANEGETLETTLTLNSDYNILINTEKLAVPLEGLDPRISLVNDDPRKYNINNKSGVPILIQKNKDVQAITIIVGDDILEFDDLDESDVIGLTIPHNVFEKIGKYQVKLFPFSFDDYESQIREDEEPITITPKEVTPKFVETEKEIPTPPKNEDKFNSYIDRGTKSGGSPSGGGRGNRFEDFKPEEEINPFTNDGSFVDRPNYDINQF